MMFKPVIENPWVRAIVALGALGLFLFLMYSLKSVLVPLFFAFIVAYIFDPLVDIFEARYKNRMRAVLLLVLALILFAILLPMAMLPTVVWQAEALINAAANPQEDQWLDRAMNTLPLDKVVLALGWAEEGEEDLNPRALIAEKIGMFVKANAATLMQQYGKDILSVGQTASSSAAALFTSIRDTILGVLLFLGTFVLFVFVTIYLLKDYDKIVAGVDDLVPPRHRPRIRNLAHRVDLQLKGFMRGQLMVCAFLGLVYTIGLTVAGTPFSLPLGLFGGAASFIPYVGIVITLIPAVLLTLLQHGIDWHIIVVLVTFGSAQALEGNVITPKIVGEQVGLGPLWVILAIMVFSTSFGFIGLLLALPIAAVLKVFVEDALCWYRKSSYFVGETPEDAGGG